MVGGYGRAEYDGGGGDGSDGAVASRCSMAGPASSFVRSCQHHLHVRVLQHTN